METNIANFRDLIRVYEGEEYLSIIINYEYYRCAVDCTKLEGEIMINRLIVHQKLRRKGIAKLLMTELCNYLDRNKFSCVLGVESEDPLGMNDDLLVEFYKQYKFESIPEDMYFMRRDSK